MIQRIQSIYLLLSAVCLGLMFVFGFAEFTSAEGMWIFTIMGLDFGTGEPENFMSVPFYIIVSLLMLYNIIVVLMFKNRKRQLFFGRVNYLLHASLIAFLHIAVYRIPKAFEEISEVSYGVGVFLPAVSLAFIFLANRGIKKDEDLVKSLDRLR